MTDFESPDFYKELYLKSMKGHELDPSELLMHTLAASVIFGNPSSTSSEWEREGDNANTGLSRDARLMMYRRARKLVRGDPLVQNVLRKFIINICATGPRAWLAADHPLHDRFKKIFPDFPALARKIVSMTLRDGELFALHLPLGENGIGHPQLRLCLPDYCTKIKLADAWSITPVVKEYTFGQLKKVVPGGNVPAANVTWFKVHEDFNDGLHGLSLFNVLINELTRYTDWLEMRTARARADSAFLILRYLKGVQGGDKHELPTRPMIIDANADVERWDVLQSGGGARDASTDGDEIRLRVAQGVGLPESEVTGNARYAAQMGRMGFPAALYEYYQAVFTHPLRRLVARTIGADEKDITIDWPFVDPRDRSQRVNEVESLARDRLISRGEVHRRLRYDHDLVEQELKKEQKEIAQIGPEQHVMQGLTLPPEMPIPQQAEQPPATAEQQQAPTEQSQPTENVKLTLPSAEIPKYGITKTSVVDTLPNVKEIAVGLDYGYSGQGAAAIGGLTDSGDFVVLGEATFKRAPMEEWVNTLARVKEKYPMLKRVFTGSDEPALGDALKKAGYEVKQIYQGISDAVKNMIEFQKHHKILINSACKALISELFPVEADVKAGMHTKNRIDHIDAMRYLFNGVTK